MGNTADMEAPYLRDRDSPIPSIESDDAVNITNSPLTSNSTSISKPSKMLARFSGIINLGESGVISLLDEAFDLDIDEAEMERLKAGAGANHKRFTLSLLYSKHTSSPPQTPSPTSIAEEERFVGTHRKRGASEGFGESPRAKRQCTRSSSAQSTPDYEAREMPNRSPGKRHKHLHNTGAKVAGRSYGDGGVIDLTQSSVSVSVSVERSEAPDAEVPQGNNEEAYTARRVKPNPTTPLQRRNSESKLSEIRKIKYESPDDQPYAIAPPENDDEDKELLVEIVSVKRIKPENISKEHNSERRTPDHSCSIAPAEGDYAVKEDHKVEAAEESSESNAHEKEKSIEVKGAPKKDWAFRHLLEDATQFFDYGNVEVDAKVENEKRQASMKPKVLGGVQPVNKLAGKPNTTPLHFNLHDQDHPRRNGTYSEAVQERPPKRQRTADAGTGSLRHSSPQDAIDLDPEPTHTRAHANKAASRSHHNHGQDERRSSNDSFGVPEYHHTESMVRPGKAGKYITQGRSMANIAKKPTVVRLDSLSQSEDRNDPISDHDDDVREVKQTVEVQVPSYQPNRGTALKAPPRPKTNAPSPSRSVSRASSQAPLGRERTRPRAHSIASSSDELAIVNGDTGKVQRPKDGTSTNKKRTARATSAVPHSGGTESPDQLAGSNYCGPDAEAKETARDLMNKRNAKASSSAPSRAQNGTSSISYGVPSSSDDEDIPAKSADMIKTEFKSATKAEPVLPPYGTSQARKDASTKPKKTSRPAAGNVYRLLEALGEKRNWLLQFPNKTWILYHEFESGDLIVYNDEKSEQFRFPSQSITRIEHTHDDGRTILHKGRGYAGEMGIGEQAKVYLELGGVEESEQLWHKLKASQTIAVNRKETEHIRKVFENQRNRPPTQKRGPPAMAEDIEHLKKKSQSKIDKELAARQEQRASNNTRALESSPYFNDGIEPQKARGLAKNMRPGSYEVDDDGSRIARSHNDEISSQTFYSARQTRSTAAPSDYESHSLVHQIDRQIAPRRARKPRSPTPPPLPRWTLENPDWEGDWHGPVSFPPIGAKRSLVEKQDIDRLDEGEFLNDSIVNFYLRWLEHNLEQTNPEVAKRIYFHNSFFYEALTKIPRGKRGINYESVKRWTSKVDLFEKDYIIVPVCENLHWYLAIICNAPRLLAPETDVEKAANADDNAQILTKIRDNPTALSSPSSATPVGSPGVDTKMKVMSLEDNQNSEDASEPPPYDRVKCEEGIETLIEVTADTEQKDDIVASEKQSADDAHPIAEIKSDLLSSSSPPSTKKPAATRKGKRASMGRKYDLNGPRILTLDSFGHTHSPTCTNLKDYLLAELKTKHQKEIPPPGSLGLTVKHIPTQPNFYDCGVFLLMYVEKFLQNPDEFVRDILQSTQNLDEDWKSTSDLRREVRDLLFDLSRKQAGDKKSQKPKAASGGDKGANRAKAKETSLPEAVSSGKSSNPSINTKSMSESDNTSDPTREQNEAPTKAQPKDDLSSKTNEESGPPHGPHPRDGLLAKLGSFGRSVSKGLGFGQEDDRSGEKVEAGKTESQPFEIEDSPIKYSQHQSVVDQNIADETVMDKTRDTRRRLQSPIARRGLFQNEDQQRTSEREIPQTPTPESRRDEYLANGIQNDLKSPSLLLSSQESDQSQPPAAPSDITSSPTKRKINDAEMLFSSAAKPKRRRSSSPRSSPATMRPSKRLAASQSPGQKRLRHAMNIEQRSRYDGLERTILGLSGDPMFPQ